MIDPKDLHNTDPPSDSLDDLMDDGLGIDQYEKDAAAKALADMPNDTEAVFTDARHQPHRPSYRQVCGVCGGSGNWRGRAGMSCFPCKGKGFVEFRTSPEVRRNDRNRSAKKKAEQADKNLADFEAQNPHIKAWWTDTDFGFALSLRESARKWGKLTENQLKAAEKCILAAEERKVEANIRIEQAPIVSIAALEACFAQAKSHLQRPRLRLAGFQFSYAPDNGVNAGAIYVKRDGTYLGKIKAGKLFRAAACDEQTEDEIVQVAHTPKEAAIAYGRLTGQCAICMKTLTNAESIERGIGPICAMNFGW